jgi:hypothetical protein
VAWEELLDVEPFGVELVDELPVERLALGAGELFSEWGEFRPCADWCGSLPEITAPLDQ